ncbi:MAG: O-antigen ligase family protein [Gemmobacter sp.]
MTLTNTGYADRAQAARRPLPSRAPSAPLIGRLPVPVIIYLILVITPALFNIGPLVMSALRVFLLIMIVPLMARLLSGRLGRVLSVDILFILHMVWALVALQVNNPDMALTQFGSLGAEMLGGYLLARAYIRSKADFIALCRWLGIIVCATLPLAILEARTGNPILINAFDAIPGLRSIGRAATNPRMGLERAQVMMSHPIHYGLFCSTAFALILMGMKGILPTAQRLGMAAGIALAVFLSLSSGALLPLIMMTFMIVWWHALHRTGRAWALLLALSALAYVAIDLLSNRTPILVFFSYATFSAHNAYWRGQIFEWGMKNVWGSPVFGIGLNDWIRPHYMNSGSMDNFWLVMAVRYGIPGFLLVAAGYAIGAARIAVARLDWDPQMAQLRRAWMITFVGLAFTLCTVHVWGNIYSYVFFMFGSGIWFIAAKPPEGGDPEDKTAAPPAPRSRYSRFAAVERPPAT